MSKELQEQFPPIPSADSADNATSADVIGNKSDTSAGTSAVALLRLIIEGMGVEGVITGTSDSGDAGTLVDATLTQANDYFNGQTLVMTSGLNIGLARIIVDFDAASDTVSFEPDFDNVVGTDTYTILPKAQWASVLVGNNNANNAADTSAVVANVDGSVLEREEYLQDVVAEIPAETGTKTFNATALAAIQAECVGAIEADNLDQLLKANLGTDVDTDIADDSALGEIMVKSVLSTWDRTTDSLEAIADSVATGSLKIAADATSTTTNIVDAVALVHTDSNCFKGAMLVATDGQNVGQARPIVAFNTGTDSVDVFPAFLQAPDEDDSFLLISSWRPNVFDQQGAVPINVTATTGTDTIFDLSVTNMSYVVNSLRLKAADPGADTITVSLWELINAVSVLVDTFDITTANFTVYYTLMDMFGVPNLTGDDLLVTVTTDVGSYAVTGQYHYSQCYTA